MSLKNVDIIKVENEYVWKGDRSISIEKEEFDK
jgi:hypothetical protein